MASKRFCITVVAIQSLKIGVLEKIEIQYIFTRTFFLRAETWHTLPRGFGVLPGGAQIYSS